MGLSARRLCSEFIDPAVLAPWLLCRLVALDKWTSVLGFIQLELGIHQGELFLRLSSQLRSDIQYAVGLQQLCAGYTAGVEAAVHTVQDLFNSENTDS